MAVLIITTKAAFLPDLDDLAGWTLCAHDGREYYVQQTGPHRLYLTECLADADKKQKIKHETLAGIVRFAQSDAAGADPGDFYLIVHDKDLLKASGNDEGIYREAGVEAVGSSLQGRIPDRHIYIFQHVARQDMFETLISKLLDDIDPETVRQTVQLIDTCSYETSFA